jgi:hypothetical protein
MATNGSTENSIFFAYPSKPEVSREALERAADALRTRFALQVRSWEDLAIGGRVLIQEIVTAIDQAHVSVFDVTTLNENVLFELGYAIAADRRIWLLRDTSDELAAERWAQTPLLHMVGYRDYVNAEDIVAAYMRDQPHADSETFFQRSIAPQLDTPLAPSLFYVRAPLPTEAEREIQRRLQRERRESIRVIQADPRESASNTLVWYANHCYLASAVVVHMLGRNRRGAAAHNARCALVAGLARGFGREVLMLCETGHWSALDYRDLLYEYSNARDCRDRIDAWLPRALRDAKVEVERRAEEAQRRVLTTELASVRLGEPVAENESHELLAYFVSTAPYRDAVERRTTIFVGRKGTGKSANMIRAADELATDRRNLVCVIQPSEYDLGGVARVIERFDSAGESAYFVETLWKYLLMTEVALSAVDGAFERPAGLQPGDPEVPLEEYLRAIAIETDFAARLESAVEAVEERDPGSNVQTERRSIAEALHANQIHTLRELLGPVLRNKRRVAFLVDNLDQGWGNHDSRATQARIVLGLLTAPERLASDIQKAASGNVEVSLGIFLRSDIFAQILPAIAEPDKLPVKRLLWPDRTTLLSVVEERFSVARGGQPGIDLWDYFDPVVDGLATQDYIAMRVQPRPRDVLHYCKAAIDAAVSHRRVRVTESDLVAADDEYSRFATGVLFVEMDEELENVVFGLAGSPPVLSSAVLMSRLGEAGVAPDACDAMVTRLLEATFLGVEIRDGEYAYAEDPGDLRRFRALSSAMATRRSAPARYKIHPAYHPFLGISDTEAEQLALT